MVEVNGRVLALRTARDEMVAARERLMRAVAGRPDAELLRSPAKGGWSAAEVLDHLRTAESQAVKAMTRISKGEPTRIPKRCWYYRLPMTPVFWSIRVPAPKPVQPRPVADLVPRQVIEEMAASRSALLALIQSMGEEAFSRFVMPHFLLGRFTGVDWLRFIGGHETKHAGQIERTLAGL